MSAFSFVFMCTSLHQMPMPHSSRVGEGWKREGCPTPIHRCNWWADTLITGTGNFMTGTSLSKTGIFCKVVIPPTFLQQ